MIIPEWESDKKADEVDVRHARTLVEGLKSKNLITKSYSIDEWSVHFKRLRVVDQCSEQLISNVLVWYITNLGQQYTPQAYSAKSFRDKFKQIQLLKDRYGTAQSEVHITQMANLIVARLNKLHWPKGSADDLPQVVQLSLNNYQLYLDKRKQVLQRLRLSKDNSIRGRLLCEFVEYLSKSQSSPEVMIEHWMKMVQQNIRNWSSWSGNLNAFILKVEHTLFQGMGKEVSTKWRGNTTYWHQFMERFNED